MKIIIKESELKRMVNRVLAESYNESAMDYLGGLDQIDDEDTDEEIDDFPSNVRDVEYHNIFRDNFIKPKENEPDGRISDIDRILADGRNFFAEEENDPDYVEHTLKGPDMEEGINNFVLAAQKYYNKYAKTDTQQYHRAFLALSSLFALSEAKRYFKSEYNQTGKGLPRFALEEIFDELNVAGLFDAWRFDPFKDNASLTGFLKSVYESGFKSLRNSSSTIKQPTDLVGKITTALRGIIYKREQNMDEPLSKEEAYAIIRRKYANSQWVKTASFDSNFEEAWAEAHQATGTVSFDATNDEEEDNTTNSIENNVAVANMADDESGIEDKKKFEAQTSEMKEMIMDAAKSYFPRMPKKAFTIYCAARGLGKFSQRSVYKNKLRSDREIVEIFNELYPTSQIDMPTLRKVRKTIDKHIENMIRLKHKKNVNIGSMMMGESKQMNIVKNMIAKTVRKALLK